MDGKQSVADMMSEIAKQWRTEADTLAKYGDEKTAEWVRNHATILSHLTAMARRETAHLAPVVPDNGTLTMNAE